LDLVNVLCPPQPGETRNPRTGELDQITPADAEIDGWCGNCWRFEQTPVPITTNVKGLRYYTARCRPCGDFRKEHGIDKPVALLRAHLSTPPKRLSAEEVDRIIATAKAASAPAKKGKKRRKGKAA